MRWVVLLLFAAPLQAQSIREFPRVTGVSSVTIVETFLYFDLDPIFPKAVFREWWAEMEACAGIEKPYDEIAWYVADIIYNIAEEREAWGVYYSPPPEIIFVREQSEIGLEDTIKHEILHHLGFMDAAHNQTVFDRCLPEG